MKASLEIIWSKFLTLPVRKPWPREALTQHSNDRSQPLGLHSEHTNRRKGGRLCGECVRECWTCAISPWLWWWEGGGIVVNQAGIRKPFQLPWKETFNSGGFLGFERQQGGLAGEPKPSRLRRASPQGWTLHGELEPDRAGRPGMALDGSNIP